MFIMELTISIFFFLNKIYLYRGKKMAWVVGCVGAILAIYYFYNLHLYIYLILEIGLIAMMLYGFFYEKRNIAIEWIVRIITIATMFSIGYLAYNGLITVLELISSIAVLIATYLLANKNQYGWIFFIVYHICATYITLDLGQYIYVLFQVMSIPIAIAALNRFNKNKANNNVSLKA